MKAFSTFSFLVCCLLCDTGEPPLDLPVEKYVSSKDASRLPALTNNPVPSDHFLLPLAIQQSAPVLRDTTVSPGISLYPNPVTEKKVFLNGSALAAGDYLVQVFSVSGKKLVQQKISRTEKEDQHLILLPGRIKPGYYSLRIEGDGYNDRTTFVVK